MGTTLSLYKAGITYPRSSNLNLNPGLSAHSRQHRHLLENEILWTVPGPGSDAEKAIGRIGYLPESDSYYIPPKLPKPKHGKGGEIKINERRRERGRGRWERGRAMVRERASNWLEDMMERGFVVEDDMKRDDSGREILDHDEDEDWSWLLLDIRTPRDVGRLAWLFLVKAYCQVLDL